MIYLYRGYYYKDVSSVDEAICDRIGERYNNIDPMGTVEFEDEWRNEVEIVVSDDVATQVVKAYIRNIKEGK